MTYRILTLLSIAALLGPAIAQRSGGSSTTIDPDEDCSGITLSPIPEPLNMTLANEPNYVCPDHEGKVITSYNNYMFVFECNVRHTGTAYRQFPAQDISECVNACGYERSTKCDGTDFSHVAKICYLYGKDSVPEGTSKRVHRAKRATAQDRKTATAAYKKKLEDERDAKIQALRDECADRNAAKAKLRRQATGRAKNLDAYACPKDDGKCYYTGDDVYQFRCNMAVRSSKTNVVTAPNVQACAEQCSEELNCDGIDFQPPSECNIKAEVGSTVPWNLGNSMIIVPDDSVCVDSNADSSSSPSSGTGSSSSSSGTATASSCTDPPNTENLPAYNCPADNGKYYYTGDDVYQFMCQTGHANEGDEVRALYASSIRECADQCTADPQCRSLDLDGRICRLKRGGVPCPWARGIAFFPVDPSSICPPSGAGGSAGLAGSGSGIGGSAGTGTAAAACPTPTCPQPVCPTPVCPSPQCYPPDTNYRQQMIDRCSSLDRRAVFNADNSFYDCVD